MLLAQTLERIKMKVTRTNKSTCASEVTYPFAEHLIGLYADVIEEDIATRAEGLRKREKEAIFHQIGLQLVKRSRSKTSKTKRRSRIN